MRWHILTVGNVFDPSQGGDGHKYHLFSLCACLSSTATSVWYYSYLKHPKFIKVCLKRPVPPSLLKGKEWDGTIAGFSKAKSLGKNLQSCWPGTRLQPNRGFSRASRRFQFRSHPGIVWGQLEPKNDEAHTFCPESTAQKTLQGLPCLYKHLLHRLWSSPPEKTK